MNKSLALEKTAGQPEFPAFVALPVARAETLTGFSELVSRLGGVPEDMLRRAQIDARVIEDPNGLIAFRSLVHLLERTASELECPDFGIRLAKAQGPSKIFSPVGVAMRNSATLGQALRYCVEHVYVYCNALGLSLETLEDDAGVFLRFDVLIDRLPHQQQMLEYTLALMHNVTPLISGGRARVRELWFTHPRVAPLKSYRQHFASLIRFEQPMNGILFEERDLNAPVTNPDRQLYQLAANFIDRFPNPQKTLSMQVRSLIGRLLKEEDSSLEQVAARLGMHPRTLQRRLREEGQSFEAMKDAVRRDTVLQFIRHKRMPLIQVAQALGYAEVSTLSRSCYRWYASSPRQLRTRLCNNAHGELEELGASH